MENTLVITDNVRPLIQLRLNALLATWKFEQRSFFRATFGLQRDRCCCPKELRTTPSRGEVSYSPLSHQSNRIVGQEL